MKRLWFLWLAFAPLFLVLPAQGQAPDTVAGIPVNYDEARTGTYTLPDPLVLTGGEPVRDAATWYQERRPEIVRLFEEHQFGRTPPPPAETPGATTAFSIGALAAGRALPSARVGARPFAGKPQAVAAPGGKR